MQTAAKPLKPSPRARRLRLAIALLWLAACGPGTAWAITPPEEWRFTVRLDGRPIGTHRFVLAGGADQGLVLSSEARFEVSLLGVPLYRYRHRANERWSDGCLSAIDARTEDNGRLTEVRGQAQDGGFDLHVRDAGRPAAASDAASDCLMSFAYWNPALAGQKQLLDPGSGRIAPVVMAAPATVPADLVAHAQPVRGLRIHGLDQPIDVWYAGNRWVGLDTTVSGGRRLSYRLN